MTPLTDQRRQKFLKFHPEGRDAPEIPTKPDCDLPPAPIKIIKKGWGK